MQWMKVGLHEISGLFVDDGAFAVTIVVGLVIAAIILSRIDVSQASKGPILFAGLVLILVESATRRARR